VVEPGVVRHTANNRWVLGEPGGQASERLAQAVALLRQSGLNTESSDLTSPGHLEQTAA